MDFTRDVYQRDYVPPKGIAIKLTLAGRDPVQDVFFINCQADEVLEASDPNFESDLLYDLNILQENTGHVDVFPAGATRADYLRTLHVSWEILPPGERDKNIVLILQGKQASPEVRAKLLERYVALEQLHPRNFISGTSGFQRYFGAQYADDLVVFENLEYGNAAYVMGENWEALRRESRTDLLARANRDFTRIPHTSQWKDRLQHTVREELQKRRRMKS